MVPTKTTDLFVSENILQVIWNLWNFMPTKMNDFTVNTNMQNIDRTKHWQLVIQITNRKFYNKNNNLFLIFDKVFDKTSNNYQIHYDCSLNKFVIHILIKRELLRAQENSNFHFKLVLW